MSVPSNTSFCVGIDNNNNIIMNDNNNTTWTSFSSGVEVSGPTITGGGRSLALALSSNAPPTPRRHVQITTPRRFPHNTTTTILSHQVTNGTPRPVPPPPPPPPQQQQQQQDRDRRTMSRSRTLRGALNLPKETQMLRSRLDKVVRCYEQSVVEYDRAQQTKVQQLKIQNNQLQAQIRDLEIENLKYASALEDDAEHIVELEGREQKLQDELDVLRGMVEQNKVGTDTFIIDWESEVNNGKSDKYLQLKNDVRIMTELLNAKNDMIQHLTRELDSLKKQLDDGKENVDLSVAYSPSTWHLTMSPHWISSMSRALICSPTMSSNNVMDNGKRDSQVVVKDSKKQPLPSKKSPTSPTSIPPPKQRLEPGVPGF